MFQQLQQDLQQGGAQPEGQQDNQHLQDEGVHPYGPGDNRRQVLPNRGLDDDYAHLAHGQHHLLQGGGETGWDNAYNYDEGETDRDTDTASEPIDLASEHDSDHEAAGGNRVEPGGSGLGGGHNASDHDNTQREQRQYACEHNDLTNICSECGRFLYEHERQRGLCKPCHDEWNDIDFD